MFNPYYNPTSYVPSYQRYPQYDTTPSYNQQNFMPKVQNLQGKLVENIESARVADIPLDGSISYFATTDGSAIVTKQLMQDGTSKIVVYKPIGETPKTPQYLTIDSEEYKSLQTEISNLKAEIESLRKGEVVNESVGNS